MGCLPFHKLALVLATLASGPLAAAAPEPDTLRLGHAAGRDGSTVSLVLRRWAQGFAFLPEAGLALALDENATPAAALAAALDNGSVDVAWLPLAAVVHGAHPLQLLELPLLGYPAEVVGPAAEALLAEEDWRAAGRLTILMAFAEAPLWLHARQLLPPSSIAGLRLYAPNPVAANWLTWLGADPVTGADRLELAEWAADGRLDGALLSWGGYEAARLSDALVQGGGGRGRRSQSGRERQEPSCGWS